MAGKRPLGIAVLAVLDGIGGVLALILGAFIAIFGGYIVRTVTGGSLPGSLSYLPGLISLASILVIPIGILGIVEAYGLWKGKRWGWWLVTILLSIGLVFGLISLVFGYISSIVSVIIDAIIVYYMIQKSTKAYFGM
jgi:hypothetical protein